MDRPNVLFLFSDQQKASVMGYENHPDVSTPSLDKLAQEGGQFRRAYCQDAFCAPSRCSLFSGLYPRILQCFDNGDRTQTMREVVSMHNPVPDVPAGPVDSGTGVWLPWANASNTPFRLFKHWLHEGGSATPFLVHWPDKVKEGRIESNYYAQVKDFMGTFMETSGAEYPETYNGNEIQSLDSKSFLGNILGEVAENGETIYLEHEGNRSVRAGDWKLVSYYSEDRGWINRKVGRGRRTGPWELYNLKEDRTELHDRSDDQAELKADLIAQFEKFAEETHVEDWEVIQRELGHIDAE